MSYYGDAQWPAGGQPGWDHPTPPTRSGLPPSNTRDSTSIDTVGSGASSTIPREESTAFWYQFEEVERAIENLVKSGKMFGMPGGRREFHPPFPPGPARTLPDFDPRGPSGAQRPHSIEFDGRSGHPSSNLQNFYASQRHQSSRGSNEAEQMMQAKRRMAAQRERELRNYHQEQQYNRTAFADMQFGPGPGPSPGPAPVPAPAPTPAKHDRTLSPGAMSEEARRELIARQRSALYGEGPFGETGGYIDETGTPRPGVPVHYGGPPGMRGPSPLAYEYGRNAPGAPETGPQPSAPASAGAQQESRNSSNASPQSNPSGNRGPFEGSAAQACRTSNSSPAGGEMAAGNKTVAPIGTRPSGSNISQGSTNPALNKQSATPLSSPLNQSYNAAGSGDAIGQNASSGTSNPASASAEGPVGLSSWPQRGGPWGPKAQTSVWG